MFGLSGRRPFHGLQYSESVWNGKTVPTDCEFEALLQALTPAGQAQRLRGDKTSLAETVLAMGEWLERENRALKASSESWTEGRYFDVEICRSDPDQSGMKIWFRLRTAGLSGSTSYGRGVRRVGVDAFILENE